VTSGLFLPSQSCSTGCESHCGPDITAAEWKIWVKRFVYFHHVRHPADMAEPEINAFLTHPAVKEKVSAST
jgi:hypothetical protein